MDEVETGSVALVVTSPPYPMVEMWDGAFSQQLGERFEISEAFNEMHRLLDEVWKEVDRILINGGIVAVNIGDATRSINGQFKLFQNHAIIIRTFERMGYTALPGIIWRKQTNSPNKFMGSGMYPPGAYITLEHEYILIFRKGGKRTFSNEEMRANRRRSAYFWEERNIWFSDLWDVKGTKQSLAAHDVRERSGAFPFEIAYRLINMFSVYGDTVIDPFLGTGTTTIASIASNRNSVGYEIETGMEKVISSRILESVEPINCAIDSRIEKHEAFMTSESTIGKKVYENVNHLFKVKTRQEVDLLVLSIASVSRGGDSGLFAVRYNKWVSPPKLC